MAKAGQLIRRPLKRARQLQNGKRRFQIKCARNDAGGHSAFRRIAAMFAFDQPANGGQGIFGIDAMAFGHLGRSSRAGNGSLGTANRRSAKFGQRIEKGGRQLGRDKRSHKCCLLKFVDGVFNLIGKAFNSAIGIKASDFTAGLDDDPVSLFLDLLRPFP